MTNDPIVEEWPARHELFAKCGYDLDRFVEYLRESPDASRLAA